MKEDLELLLMALESSLFERQQSSSSIRYKDASRNFHRIRAEFWRTLGQRLDHPGLARQAINVASEVPVNRVKPKDTGTKKWQEACMCPCAGGSLRQGGPAQRHTLRHQRVARLDARSDPFAERKG